jgi:hypothetical protein
LTYFSLVLFSETLSLLLVLFISQKPAAGDYIDRMLRDIEKKGIQADGSTELGCFVALRLGWGSIEV